MNMEPSDSDEKMWNDHWTIQQSSIKCGMTLHLCCSVVLQDVLCHMIPTDIIPVLISCAVFLFYTRDILILIQSIPDCQNWMLTLANESIHDRACSIIAASLLFHWIEPRNSSQNPWLLCKFNEGLSNQQDYRRQATCIFGNFWQIFKLSKIFGRNFQIFGFPKIFGKLTSLDLQDGCLKLNTNLCLA